MSVPAPPTRFFDANTASITPPLDDGWAHLQEGSICRPWMVQVFNLRLSDFVAAPTSLADLAFADHAGNPIENAGDLGAIVGLLLWGTVDFIMYGYYNLSNLNAVIADTVLEGVRGGIVGAVIAAVLAKVGD